MKIKVDKKEYDLLKSIHKNVDKWAQVDCGGKTVVLNRKKGTITTDEGTLYQGKFLRANERLISFYKKNK